MRFKKDDLVLIRESVFAEKVGKIGVITRVDPGWDNPYEVDVPGGTTSRFQGHELKETSVKEALRLYNLLSEQVDDLSARVAAVEERVAPGL